MESFLKEQLKRLQDLAAQMSSLEKSAAELSAERMRQQDLLSHGPLADLRGFRTQSSVSDRREARATADRDDSHSRRRHRRRRRRRS
jgi:hypothetical protein